MDSFHHSIHGCYFFHLPVNLIFPYKSWICGALPNLNKYKLKVKNQANDNIFVQRMTFWINSTATKFYDYKDDENVNERMREDLERKAYLTWEHEYSISLAACFFCHRCLWFQDKISGKIKERRNSVTGNWYLR